MGGKTKVATTTNQTRADIPQWLQPFLQQSANTAGGALSGLESSVGDIMDKLPASVGDLNAQAFNEILNYTGGSDPARNLAEQKLMGIAGGRAGRDLASQYNQLGAQPGEYQGQAFNQQPVNADVNSTFTDLMQRFDPNSAGVQASADASIRAARPYIYSGFGKSGGVGAVKSGLAQTAMQQAASDAFARLYDSAENRRLGAAQGMSSAEAQKAQAAAMAAQAAAARQRNRISERALSGDLLARERGNQMGAAGTLLGMSPQDAALLQGAAAFPLNAQTGLLSGSAGAIPANVIGNTTTSQQPYKTGGLGSVLGSGLALGSMFVPGMQGLGAAAGMMGGLLGGGGDPRQSAQSYVNTFYS